MKMLSFVIPARNESESLERLLAEIQNVCDWNDYAFEVILVDDGSTDSTWKEIQRLSYRHKNLRGIRLRKNFGKGPALTAGFKVAKGDIIFTMDADLQDNPEDIPKFVEALREDKDVVVGWRKTRRDKPAKRLLSKLFNAAVARTGLKLHDHNCGFKCFRAEALQNMQLYGDMHRYMPILAHMNGFHVVEVEVNHRERVFGKSNYGLSRTYRGFFDLLTILFLKGFRHRPLHFLGSVGMISLVVGGTCLLYLAAAWLTGTSIGRRPLLIYSTALMIFGTQVLSIGILGELMTAYMARFETTYSIREETNVSYGQLEGADDDLPTNHESVSSPLPSKELIV